jgi:hypothetical protein
MVLDLKNSLVPTFQKARSPDGLSGGKNHRAAALFEERGNEGAFLEKLEQARRDRKGTARSIKTHGEETISAGPA